MKSRHKLLQKQILFFLYVVFGILMITIFFFTEHKIFSVEQPVDVSQGWRYQTDEEHYILKGTHLVTQAMEGRTLSFYTSDSYVDVVLSNKKLYHFGQRYRFGRSPGSYVHFIEIPRGSGGQMLTVTVQTVYPHKFRTSYEFLAGGTADLVYQYLKKDFICLILNFIILISGIVMGLLYMVERKVDLRSGRNFYLALMSLTFVVWANCSLFTNQMIFQNAQLQYYLNYFSLFMLPLSFLMYVEALSSKMHCYLEYTILSATILVCSVLHFCGIRDYTLTVRYFCILCVVCMVILVGRIIRELREDVMRMASLLIFIEFLFLNMLNFLFRSTFDWRAWLAQIGITVYLFYSIYAGMRQMLREMALLQETALLKQIAYIDKLTGIANRYALARDLAEMDLTHVGIVSMDLNDLKKCNDNYGHVAGDHYLLNAARVLRQVYSSRLYRTGGDEFLALLEDVSREEYLDMRKRVQEAIVFYAEQGNVPVHMEIASGYACYQPGDESYESILKRADQEMYKDKHRLKRAEKREQNESDCERFGTE